MNIFPVEQFKRWFIARRRDLPWRNDPTPYQVWVSEIMLQQTQVAVVIPYYTRWMKQFPSIEALAAAPIEQVLKAWEGLGYYSRARNLHKGALAVLEQYSGKLPSDPKLLATIPGIGPYTVGAIRAFAFHQKAAAVDGNVFRVLARYEAIEDPIDHPATQRMLRTYAEELLPEIEPWLVAEGLIELGATTCGRTPKCERCPLRSSCQAHTRNLQSELPRRRPRVKITELVRDVAIIQHNDQWLLRKGSEGRVMADLYEFPYWERKDTPLEELIRSELALDSTRHTTLDSVTHGFTRYRATLHPVHFRASHALPINGMEWHSWETISTLPFSSGHRRILQQLEELLCVN